MSPGVSPTWHVNRPYFGVERPEGSACGPLTINGDATRCVRATCAVVAAAAGKVVRDRATTESKVNLLRAFIKNSFRSGHDLLLTSKEASIVHRSSVL